MFGLMKAQPILKVGACSAEQAVQSLLIATENAQPVRWIEFPNSLLLLVAVPGEPDSGALYVLDRKTNSWLVDRAFLQKCSISWMTSELQQFRLDGVFPIFMICNATANCSLGNI